VRIWKELEPAVPRSSRVLRSLAKLGVHRPTTLSMVVTPGRSSVRVFGWSGPWGHASNR